MKLADIGDAVGMKVIPDIDALRTAYQQELGLQRGNYAADALPVDGWTCVYDMRLIGRKKGALICERAKPDGSIQSLDLQPEFVRSVWPAKLA